MRCLKLLGAGCARLLHGTLIDSVQADADPQAVDVQIQYLLPALANVHSHAFQRAMAGMTEYRGQSADNFWTWRDLMYGLSTY